ncbi:MAG: hypothetical protein LBM99_05130 [Bacillales bacterium]|jgi:hypothetical protein|nr:hypothetical protein [Bacillales bacterium]
MSNIKDGFKKLGKNFNKIIPILLPFSIICLVPFVLLVYQIIDVMAIIFLYLIFCLFHLSFNLVSLKLLRKEEILSSDLYVGFKPMRRSFFTFSVLIFPHFLFCFLIFMVALFASSLGYLEIFHPDFMTLLDRIADNEAIIKDINNYVINNQNLITVLSLLGIFSFLLSYDIFFLFTSSKYLGIFSAQYLNVEEAKKITNELEYTTSKKMKREMFLVNLFMSIILLLLFSLTMLLIPEIPAYLFIIIIFIAVFIYSFFVLLRYYVMNLNIQKFAERVKRIEVIKADKFEE